MKILTEFTEEQFSTLCEYMRPLWIETYGGFLPAEQIDFLLNKYFSEEGLRYYRAQGYQYRTIQGGGVLVYAERETDVYLDKLYLPPSARGKNIPKAIFDELLTLGKDVVLNVNENNKRAVACYLKNGFSIEERIEIPLGNGMVNCDYVMRKKAL